MDYSNFSILYGEDEPDDIRMFSKMLQRMNYNGEYHQFALGQKVLDWTLKRGEFTGARHPVPDLIILDIGLLGMDGKGVMDVLKSNIETKMIPVLILSGSSSLKDCHKCIELGCNGYIQKSMDPNEYEKICSLFIEGWARLKGQEFF